MIFSLWVVDYTVLTKVIHVLLKPNNKRERALSFWKFSCAFNKDNNLASGSPALLSLKCLDSLLERMFRINDRLYFTYKNNNWHWEIEQNRTKMVQFKWDGCQPFSIAAPISASCFPLVEVVKTSYATSTRAAALILRATVVDTCANRLPQLLRLPTESPTMLR